MRISVGFNFFHQTVHSDPIRA